MQEGFSKKRRFYKKFTFWRKFSGQWAGGGIGIAASGAEEVYLPGGHAEENLLIVNGFAVQTGDNGGTVGFDGNLSGGIALGIAGEAVVFAVGVVLYEL